MKEIVGVDISTGAVERCNQRFKEEGANEGCFAIEANIMTDPDVLSGRKFDLVYVSSSVGPPIALLLIPVYLSAPPPIITSKTLKRSPGGSRPS